MNIAVEPMHDALDAQDATGLAELVQRGELAPQELLERSIARIERLDPLVNAITVRHFDAARASLATLDRLAPFAGVPFLLKDLAVAMSGTTVTNGSRFFAGLEFDYDGELVRRFRRAGLVILGKAASPELGLTTTTESAQNGATRNPWQLDRVAGGSSGGSAAAVAAGMVPIAHGNDGMGSIRIPAACTGLVGIKPGRGVVPTELGETDWYGLSENGPLATTVADAALLLSVMADDPSLAAVAPPDARLRVALSFRPPVAGVTLDPAFAAAAETVAAVLLHAGHDVRRAEPVKATDAAGNAAAIAGLTRWFAGTAGDADAVVDPSALESRVRRHARIGRLVRRTPLMNERLRDAWIRHATQFLGEYDVLVTPALAQQIGRAHV